jgi:hypothetical protein
MSALAHQCGAATRLLSSTPRFSGFYGPGKTAEAVGVLAPRKYTPLKRGVDEGG